MNACFPFIDLRDILVPWGDARSVPLGPISPERVKELRDRDFDQAPVTEGRMILGMISRRRLEELMAAGQPLTENDPACVCECIRSQLPLDRLFDEMTARPCAIVETQYDADGHSSVEWHGFVTLADLNKHPVRALMYPWLARLESQLARLVDRHFNDPWSWLRKLDRDKQARLIGYWELSKRDGVDVGPIAGATMTELVRVIACEEVLFRRFGFDSKNKWDEFTWRILELRNQVMHPVRALVTQPELLPELTKALAHVMTLSDNAAKLLLT